MVALTSTKVAHGGKWFIKNWIYFKNKERKIEELKESFENTIFKNPFLEASMKMNE